MFQPYKSAEVGTLLDIDGTIAVKTRMRGNVWRVPATPGWLHPKDLFNGAVHIARRAGYEFDDPQFKTYTVRDWVRWALKVIGDSETERINAFLAGCQLYGYPVPVRFTMADTELWPVPGAPRKDFRNT